MIEGLRRVDPAEERKALEQKQLSQALLELINTPSSERPSTEALAKVGDLWEDFRDVPEAEIDAALKKLDPESTIDEQLRRLKIEADALIAANKANRKTQKTGTYN